MQTLIIHGRQPELGRAELESLYGAERLQPIGGTATLIDMSPQELDFMRLGGMVKFAKILTVLETASWLDIESYLLKVSPQHFTYMPEGKLKIGLSAYDLKTNVKHIQTTALKLKKAAKQTGRSLRIIPNKELALNSASVLHNKLTHKLGWELLFVRWGNKTIIAQSIAVQDIDAYRRRDQERPFRDARVGMLPPKLAQTIINLAVGKLDDSGKPACGPISSSSFSVLDPFCGTGVILQEAALMGYQAHGTDLEPRMAGYAEKNLAWLAEKFLGSSFKSSVGQADATRHKWPQKFDTVACETYLGRPLSSAPDSALLQKIVSDCDVIHKKFLRNLAQQTKPGFRACIAVPAWKTKDGFQRLPTLDKLSDMGYNRIKFTHIQDNELIYHRPGQIVGRELIVIERKQ